MIRNCPFRTIYLTDELSALYEKEKSDFLKICMVND
jgi:hypothetical protein